MGDNDERPHRLFYRFSILGEKAYHRAEVTTMSELPAFKKPWSLCVGSERVSTMLRTEYWDRFDEAKRAIGFRYIRCHGLLCDDIGLFRMDEWEGKKRAFFNFTYIDQAFDAMLEHGVRPFIELGFMPEALASGKQTIFWWKGNTTAPSDYSLWAELVQKLLSHLAARYGVEELRLWPVEVWNEPNLAGFWEGADQAAYFKLYETTARAVKSVDESIRVGGPAICGGSDHWIEDFLSFVKERGLPLDFFSRHLYTGQTPSLRSPELLYQSLSDPGAPARELKEVRKRIDGAGFPGLELHITEFNTSYNPLCPVHDTALNAAYLARLLAESGDLAESLSYWTFCDLFEECDVPRSLFHGGFGLVARYGIAKPTFHLFAFFQKLGDSVVYRDDHCVATLRRDGCLAVAAWNPVMESGERAPLAVDIELPWSGDAVLALRSRVHEGAGNPWGLWREMGRPRFPDPRTVELLKEAAHPAVSAERLYASRGKLKLSLSLERNEVTLVELSAFADESPSYLGLDDARIDGY
jgi:xylan 1,4-beta-xylosidase